MAKKPEIKSDTVQPSEGSGRGLIRKTESDKPSGPTITRGVGLKQGEWGELEAIGADLGQSLHYMTAYAVRYFLKKYRDGEIQPENKPSLPDL